jgi:hypothetical protein
VTVGIKDYAMRGKGRLIPYERFLLARALRSRTATIEGLARIAAASGQTAVHLRDAGAALERVMRACTKAGERFEESARFRAECEAAARLGSVEAMIRRRDELLERHRRRSRR